MYRAPDSTVMGAYGRKRPGACQKAKSALSVVTPISATD